MKKAMTLALVAAVCSTFGLAVAVAATDPAKPNIVIFLADDMGFADCGAYGCKDVPTPTIDALARDGVRF